MAPSSVCDDFEMPHCFSPLLASQSLSAYHSLHCNMFCGSRVSPILRNQSSISCNSALYCSFWSGRRAIYLILILRNNSVTFRLTQSTSGLSTAHLLLSYSACVQSHNFSHPNTLIARFLFCNSSLFICFTSVGKSMPV